MKKLILALLLIFVYSCNSEYNFDSQERVIYTEDEEGDPVIEIVDEDDYREKYNFGADGGSCYGYDTPDAEKAFIDTNIAFPPSFDLSAYLPEIGSQGNQGSCVAWATGYYLKSFQENYEDAQNGNTAMENVMSPAFIYNQIKVSGCPDGSNVQRAIDTLVTAGIPSWDLMPYDENDCDTQPEDLARTLALPNRIDSYYYLDGDLLLEQAKAFLLNNQPIVISLAVDPNYFGARDSDGYFIYRKFKEAVSGHAMLVVGYDDDLNAFKVANSWGKEWGNNGFLWLDYRAFTEATNNDSDFQVLCEAWVTNDIVQAQPASL